jgi:hypothetical protein
LRLVDDAVRECERNRIFVHFVRGGEVDQFVLFGKGRHLTMSHALLGTCPGSEYSIRVN